MGILNDICKGENITLAELTDELGKMLTENSNIKGRGLAVKLGGNKYIFVDKNAPIWEMRFIIAHEIAHHLLGHLEPDTAISHEVAENEADIFASVMVALLLFQEYEKVENITFKKLKELIVDPDRVKSFIRMEKESHA